MHDNLFNARSELQLNTQVGTRLLMHNNYEGKVCDAAVKVIEKRTGRIRTQVRRPEVDRVGPQVDLRFKLGDQEYAIEHTLVEPFEN